MREEFAAAGLRRGDRAVWNVVPWCLGDGAKARNPPLFAHLSGLEVLLALGTLAREGWRTFGLDLPHVAAPHPSHTNPCARPRALDGLRMTLAQTVSWL